MKRKLQHHKVTDTKLTQGGWIFWGSDFNKLPYSLCLQEDNRLYSDLPYKWDETVFYLFVIWIPQTFEKWRRPWELEPKLCTIRTSDLFFVQFFIIVFPSLWITQLGFEMVQVETPNLECQFCILPERRLTKHYVYCA